MGGSYVALMRCVLLVAPSWVNCRAPTIYAEDSESTPKIYLLSIATNNPEDHAAILLDRQHSANLLHAVEWRVVGYVLTKY
jgi:hypothetical protein